MTDFDKVRAILDAATPGPWKQKFGSLYPDAPQPGAEPIVDFDGRSPTYGIWPILSGENYAADARAIVVSRNLAPELLAVAEAAETARAGLGSFLWLGNNLHNWDTQAFREMFVAALGDAQRGYDDSTAALDALDAKMRETLP